MPGNLPVTVTAACASEADALARLHAACFAQGWGAQAFRDLLATGTAFIARDADGLAAGFAVVRNVAGEAEILTLGVLPQYRRRAVGYALAAHIRQWAAQNGVEIVFLEVREANRAAVALYRKAGFREAGLRRDYYRNPDGGSEHAVVMRYSVS